MIEIALENARSILYTFHAMAIFFVHRLKGLS